MTPTSYWPGNQYTSWPVCPQCGTAYIGQHFCSARPATAPSEWRLADIDVERIAQRVVDLLRQKRMTEQ